MRLGGSRGRSCDGRGQRRARLPIASSAGVNNTLHSIFVKFVAVLAAAAAIGNAAAAASFGPTPAAGQGVPALFRYDPSTIRYEATVESKMEKAVVWLVRYNSPVQTAWPANNTVWAHYYQPRTASAQHPVPAVLALHTFGSKNARFCRRFIRLLLNHGIAGAYVELPYHMHRQPPGHKSHQLFVRADTSHLVEVMRQAAMDVRCMVDWLSRRPEVDARRIAVAGFSLGGTVGALVYVVEPRLGAAALVGGGGRPAELVWHSGILAATRRRLERQGVGLDDLRVIMRPVDPCTYATPERGRHVLLINARHDWVVPTQCTAALWKALGRPKIIWLNSGHFSMFAHPDKLNREMLNWLLVQFGMARRYRARYRGEALKVGFVHGKKIGNVAAVMWELQPLDRRGRTCLEVGMTTGGVGLVGISGRIFRSLSVGWGVPIGKHPARAEPYFSVHLTF